MAKRRIITSEFIEDIMSKKPNPEHLDPSYMRQLLETAKEDLNSAKTNPDKRQRNAIIELQQAVEKTAKAYYVGAGTTNESLHKVSHQTPKIFVNLFKEHEGFIFGFFLKHRKALKHWKKPSELQGILSLEKEMSELKKDEILSLFAVIDTTYDKTRSKIENIGVIAAKNLLTQLSKEGLGKKLLTPQIIKEFASDKQLQLVLVDLFIAFLYLYVLAMITSPHAKSRYPDTQLIDYGMGSGLFECFELVANKTEFAINSLETFLQKILLLKVKLAVASAQNTTTF